MHKKSKRETVIDFLLNLDREYTKGKLHVDVSRKSFNIPNMTEEEFIYEISLLESDYFISVNFPSGHRDLSVYITITLCPPILHYYENKSVIKKQNTTKWIQFWIPVVISTLALLWNIGNTIYSSYLKELINGLMK